jgi:crossover junction endodeoxyribonuclease RuvC
MGVDPGLTRCGLSVLTGSRGGQIVALDADVLRMPADEWVPKRLLALSAHVEYWLDNHHPGVRAAR